MSSEPPEEPQLRSEPNVLSPTSPKPIHFPAPTSITVLEMQMDVNFNQTDAHMNDPSTHNTELRPDVWRDPNEELATATADQPSPYSTGGEAAQTAEDEAAQTSTEPMTVPSVEIAELITNEDMQDSMDNTVTNDQDHREPNPASTSQQSGSVFPEAAPIEPIVQPSSDPSIPTAEATAPSMAGVSSYQDAASQAHDTAEAQPMPNAVDVHALFNTFNSAPTATSDIDTSNVNALLQSDATNMAAILSPSSFDETQQQQANVPALPPGVEGISSPTSASGPSAPPSGLPPRPPPQEQPLIHPNYVHTQHIRDYHPHAANPAFQPTSHSRTGSQGNAADPSSKNYVPPVHSPTSATVPQSQTPLGFPSNITIPGNVPMSNGSQQQLQAAPGTLNPYSPSAALSQNAAFVTSPQNMYGMQYPPETGTPTESRRERTTREGDQARPEDRPWDAEVQRKYDRFIEDERRYVSEGRWEQFPQGSRLFVGNLSSEKVTKRDIFHVFHTYGSLAQISIKQAYGFVQFLQTEDCVRALQIEQGTQIRDKKIHLEVSKPQKNRTQNTQNTQRRSRSPPDNARARPGSNIDRYVSGSRTGSNRGSYGSYRSPSPPRGYRDRYDNRNRRRSPSPDYNRGSRYRSPSPRKDVDDDLPLPRRAPRDVPDVQIIVLDTLDRDFIQWVESSFSGKVRVDVLLLSPRLSEQAVVKRQIVEGVIAVVKLTRQDQNTGKVGLQIFDRSQGANNVKFEEYEGLDPSVAAQLVQRAKQAYGAATGGAYGSYGGSSYTSSVPSQSYSSYGAPSAPPVTGGYYNQPQQPSYPGYSQPPPPQGGPPPGVPSNLQHLITNLDPNNLQNLLSAMSTPQSAGPTNAYAPPNPTVAALQNNPALVGYLQQQQQQQAQSSGGSGGQVNMQDILARLGTGQR